MLSDSDGVTDSINCYLDEGARPASANTSVYGPRISRPKVAIRTT